jgi:hypothetical protein
MNDDERIEFTLVNKIDAIAVEKALEVDNYRGIINALKQRFNGREGFYRFIEVLDKNTEINEQSLNESTENDDKTVEDLSAKPKRKKASTKKVDEVALAKQDEVVTDVQNTIEDSKPKLSWRDKMKVKIAENSEHYENLDNVLERKNNN